MVCALALPVIARADILTAQVTKPTWTRTIGNARVERYGAGDPALILIPGLSCGPWVFGDTIARESKTHAVYALTPAGFDGVPPGSNDSFDGIDASLTDLIAREKLVHPVLVGDGMGGTVALRYGIEHAATLGGIVSIDGTPVYPSLSQATAQIREESAKQFSHAVATDPPKIYADQAMRTIAEYVSDATLAAEAGNLSLRSDQSAVAAYGYDLYATDLRPHLGMLTVRTLLVMPVPGPPIPAYYPASMESMSVEQRRGHTLAFYQALFAGAPQLTIVPVDNSRRFVAFDQPVALAQTLDEFLLTVHV
jgi:pimeloyl-ACP methyl ester carboxylesterase